MLPGMSDANGLSLIDAFFTSTSAVCVTGLTTINLADHFTFPGQAVVLILIQMGGLGIVFYSTFILLMGKKRFSLAQEEILGSTIALDPEFKKKHLARSILKFTLGIEFFGFLLLMIFWHNEFSLGQRAWHSLFHSVSAFCNAGFSTFSNSLESYSKSVGVNLVIMALIVIGGLGFVNYKELQLHLRRRQLKWHKFSLFLKISLSYSFGLIIAGALLLLLFDYNSEFAQLDAPHKILVALFHSVSARTAGFNTVPINHFTNASLFILSILMFVGGGSGSTAGGVKVTTVATIMAVFRSRLINDERVHLFGRRLGVITIRRSLTLFMISEVIVVFAILFMQTTEIGLVPHTEIKATFLEYVFETFSALGTVGLSTGVTGSLTVSGKILTIILMFIGRLGPLSFLVAWLGTPAKAPYTFPEENLPVG